MYICADLFKFQYSSVRAEQYEFPVSRDVASESSTKVDGRSILLTEPY